MTSLTSILRGCCDPPAGQTNSLRDDLTFARKAAKLTLGTWHGLGATLALGMRMAFKAVERLDG